ncbi:19582_t:CDS:1, partial [Funneliformis geosporum]
ISDDSSKPNELNELNKSDKISAIFVKRKPCQGLSGGKYQQYIERIPVEVRGTRQHEIIAIDLFSTVSKFQFKYLYKEQITEFN